MQLSEIGILILSFSLLKNKNIIFSIFSENHWCSQFLLETVIENLDFIQSRF